MVQEGEAVGRVNAKHLMSFKKTFDECSDEVGLDAVRLCKLAKAHDQKFVKLYLALPGLSAYQLYEQATSSTPVLLDMRAVIIQSLVQLGGTRKQGTAPPSGLERLLQNYIDGDKQFPQQW